MRDLYLYENTDILKNKFNIRNKDILEQMETDFTTLRLKQVIENPLNGKYDFEHFCKLHWYIFQDVYEWAGQPRIINIEKSEPVLNGLSIEYADYTEIKILATSTLSKMRNLDWIKIDIDERAIIFSKLMSELWKVHAFREGNTRTTITFCCQLLDSRGCGINRSLFAENSKYMRNALVAASAVIKGLGDRSKPEYLVKIVKDAMQQKRNSIKSRVSDAELKSNLNDKNISNKNNNMEL